MQYFTLYNRTSMVWLQSELKKKKKKKGAFMHMTPSSACSRAVCRRVYKKKNNKLDTKTMQICLK